MKYSFSYSAWARTLSGRGFVCVPDEVASHPFPLGSFPLGSFPLGSFPVLRGDGSKSRAEFVFTSVRSLRNGTAVVKIVSGAP